MNRIIIVYRGAIAPSLNSRIIITRKFLSRLSPSPPPPPPPSPVVNFITIAGIDDAGRSKGRRRTRAVDRLTVKKTMRLIKREQLNVPRGRLHLCSADSLVSGHSFVSYTAEDSSCGSRLPAIRGCTRVHKSASEKLLIEVLWDYIAAPRSAAPQLLHSALSGQVHIYIYMYICMYNRARFIPAHTVQSVQTIHAPPSIFVLSASKRVLSPLDIGAEEDTIRVSTAGKSTEENLLKFC